MATICAADISVKYSEYRPCIVNGKKALFHRWENRASIVPPSPMVGGHSGGVITDIAGIVEFEDGTVAEVYPYNIRFVDNPFAEIAFPEERKQEKQKKPHFEEAKIDCPFCKTVGGAILYADAEHKEYFAYCTKCEVETIESFKTPQAAVSAFKNGKTKKIRGSDNG